MSLTPEQIAQLLATLTPQVGPEAAGRAVAAMVGSAVGGAEAAEASLRLFHLTGRHRRWKKKHLPRTYKATSHGHFRHLLRHLGRELVMKISPQRIEEYQEARLAEISYRKTPPEPQTINLECKTLYATLQWYCKRERAPRLSRNPMKGWKMLRVRNKRNFHIPPQDIARFLYEANPVLRMMTILSCELGFRKGEVIHLEWAEIDRKNRRVNLSEDKVKDGEDRTIVLSDAALAILDMIPAHADARWVFSNPKWSRDRKAPPGTAPYHKATIYSWLVKARNMAGITGPKGQKVWFHSFRKSWATFMMEQGMEPEMIREQGGWSSEAIARIYKQYSPAYAERALKHMNTNPAIAELVAIVAGKRHGPKAATPPPELTARKASGDDGEE